MTDTARVLLTAGVTSASAFAAFAWHLTRSDTAPERLVGQLRLAQLAAVLLAAMGGLSIGLAVGSEAIQTGTIDLTAGVAFAILAGVILRLEPRDALLVAAGGFLLQALVDLSHRPGWLSTDLAPRWYIIGSAIYDVFLAAVCYWARRR